MMFQSIDVMHVCKKCGPLTESEVYINRKNMRNGHAFTVCKHCANLSYNKGVMALSDHYVRKLLRSGTKLRSSDFPMELVELKRAQVELKRLKQKKDREDLEQWIREQFISSNTKVGEQL